ncbi:DMT family transporter [Clostridium sp. DJ247]|uniref:DMT family transporter n=1 Tax=Clostridium sp. DJ247 TaxID=2726188 RepID=UPI001627E6DF|nr:DMT family transporter [Clostridium sp. DJ247]MBC2582315.1 EamA-like transporter family protein [Clostridium sp. DJ247]
MVVGLLLSFISGCVSIISKLVNFKLTKKIGLLNGTLVNYIVASLISLIAILALGSYNFIGLKIPNTVPLWIYSGGIFGLISLLLGIIVLPRIPLVYSTILIILGQLGTSFIIDVLINKKFSTVKLIGVILVLLGVIIDKLAINYINEKRQLH